MDFVRKEKNKPQYYSFNYSCCFGFIICGPSPWRGFLMTLFVLFCGVGTTVVIFPHVSLLTLFLIDGVGFFVALYALWKVQTTDPGILPKRHQLPPNHPLLFPPPGTEETFKGFLEGPIYNSYNVPSDHFNFISSSRASDLQEGHSLTQNDTSNNPSLNPPLISISDLIMSSIAPSSTLPRPSIVMVSPADSANGSVNSISNITNKPFTSSPSTVQYTTDPNTHFATLNGNPEQHHELPKRRIVGDKYCVKCGIFRPRKVKHCYICNNCVYGFDHHCDFVNNCIGARNHRFFALFLLACAWGLLVYSVAIFFILRNIVKTALTPWFITFNKCVALLVCFGLDVVLFIPLGIFGAFQVYLIMSDQTTVSRIYKDNSNARRTWLQSFYDRMVKPPASLMSKEMKNHRGLFFKRCDMIKENR